VVTSRTAFDVGIHAGVSETPGEFDVVPLLYCQQEKSENRKGELQSLGVQLARGYGFLAPGGTGPRAQAPHLPNGHQIEESADESQQDHRDADRINVKVAVNEPQKPGSTGNRGRADKEAQAAQCDEGRAHALHERKE